MDVGKNMNVKIGRLNYYGWLLCVRGCPRSMLQKKRDSLVRICHA